MRLSHNNNNNYLIGEVIFAILSRLPVNIWHVSVKDNRIEKICSILKKNPGKHWSTSELADKVYFSDNAFIRRFKEVMGEPPQVYLQKLRIERIAELLMESELSIEDIASECGFCDRHYLSRTFKKHYKQSPGQFRTTFHIP
ncbi:MAG: helix-turn-helix transcriptional regulator [Lentisphaerae bacterium]|nr:helix-turn-helix transcriptional regulator [Lentisphaerota bacterium]MCP4103341.1 helix-turn-helix transcriptional regulator [Lentisphaerota bacterium]